MDQKVEYFLDDQNDAAAGQSIGERIAEARVAAGLSQKELAHRLGVKTSTIKSWEKDKSEPRSNKLIMLSGLVNVSPSWLLVGGGEAPGVHDTPVSKGELFSEIRELQSLSTHMAERLEQLAKRLS